MAPLNLYDISVPNVIHSLTALSNILTKASETASSKNLSLESLTTGRLAEDMLPLTFQVQTACNTAKFISVRVAGHANVEMEDNEKTFDDLQARISKTIDFLKGVEREEFEGKEAETVAFRDFKFTGLSYVTKYALPNFYFHVTAAYAILRMKGIEVGKMDFLGAIKGVDIIE